MKLTATSTSHITVCRTSLGIQAALAQIIVTRAIHIHYSPSAKDLLQTGNSWFVPLAGTAHRSWHIDIHGQTWGYDSVSLVINPT